MSPPRILIIGAVAGGMSAATRARRLCESAHITVLEKGAYVSYANCGIPYALGGVIDADEKLLLHTPESVKRRFNVDVRVGEEVVGIERGERGGGEVLVRRRGGGMGRENGAVGEGEEVVRYVYDKLILAMGAQAIRLPIQGVEMECVFSLQTIGDLKGVRGYIQDRGCKRAVVVGGGFIGLEAVENLKRLGLEVSVVEYADHVLATIDAEIAEVLHTELRKKGVELYLKEQVVKIEQSDSGIDDLRSVAVCTASGIKIPTDLIIMAVGIRPRTTLAAAAALHVSRTGISVNKYMQTSDPDIYAVGDMTSTPHLVLQMETPMALAGPANRQGRIAADHIFGKKTAYRENVGTAVCKVFDLCVGSTGCSVEALNKFAGSEAQHVQWITVHPPDHAGYYPGATPITLRVVFDANTGLVLGAQAVGRKGVDKAIDVLAMALQARMTIEDLEHVELAYAPPYGSAKAPVNMAGFVGSNVLRGDVKIMHTAELTRESLEGLQVVDVRSESEFEKGHVVGAVNLPIDKLREGVGMLDRGTRVLVYCFVGYRGYLAYRILVQMGFDVVNLDGGFKSVVEGGHEDLVI